MNEIGEVVVVAPDSPQSGMGHAITMTSTLYCDLVHIDEGKQTEYSCNGTPADCIKNSKARNFETNARSLRKWN